MTTIDCLGRIQARRIQLLARAARTGDIARRRELAKASARLGAEAQALAGRIALGLAAR
jgi:hypothetical protein